MVFPSLLTWIYFVALGDNSGSAQQLAYAIGKAVQFGFPVFWFVCVQRCKLKLRIPSTDGLALGMGFGLLVVGAMFLFYQLVLLRFGLFDEARLQIQEKVSGFGIGSVGAFVGLAMFYSVCHSFLEEYYWRWFVFGQLRQTRSFVFAALVSSLGFMAHHVIMQSRPFWLVVKIFETDSACSTSLCCAIRHLDLGMQPLTKGRHQKPCNELRSGKVNRHDADPSGFLRGFNGSSNHSTGV